MSFRQINVIAVRAFQTPTAEATSTSSPRLRVDNAKSNPQLGLSLPTLLIFVFLLVTVAIIVTYRLFRLRRQGRPFSQFFAPAAKPSKYRVGLMSEAGLLSLHASHSPNPSTHSIIYPSLTTPPATHTPPRLRATDLDSSGRRLGIPDLEHGQFDFNDLPAYEKAGGPPKYGGLDGPPQYVGGESVGSYLTSDHSTRAPADL